MNTKSENFLKIPSLKIKASKRSYVFITESSGADVFTNLQITKSQNYKIPKSQIYKFTNETEIRRKAGIEEAGIGEAVMGKMEL